MFVEQWMTPDPVTLPPNATISFAAMEMRKRKFRHLPIAEPTRTGLKLVGIVSKYDIARGFPHDLNPFSSEVFDDTVPRRISAVMTRKVLTTTTDCAIEEAARVLRIHRIGALPVLRQNRLVGIITESDIFDAFVSITAAKSGGVRMILEADADDSPIAIVTELSGKFGVEILSILFRRRSSSRLKDLCIFRFGARPRAGFIDEICKAGLRVVSVAH
jgi:acetoin utilization protein AcuB